MNSIPKKRIPAAAAARPGKAPPDLAYRLSVGSRVLAAAIGGYGLVGLWCIAMQRLLASISIDPAQALLTLLLLSFLAYTAIVMAVVHARSALRAWLWLIVSALPPGAIVAALPPAM